MDNEVISEYYKKAKKVDFLTEQWEVVLYASALLRAKEWGKRIDRKNSKYKRSNLLDKYNHYEQGKKDK